MICARATAPAASGRSTSSRAAWERAERAQAQNLWITRLTPAQVQMYLERLNERPIEELPLFGIPFVIKDNIDLAGVATTAACREFAYLPERSATVVQRLIEAGAIPLGKTNLDQFATGLGRHAIAVRRSAATASIRTTFPAARARAPPSPWRPVSQALRSAPTPQARDGCRRPSTTSWASSRASDD